MASKGLRDYVVFVTDLRKHGMGEMYEAAMRGKSTRPMVERLAEMFPDKFPEGYKLVVIAKVPASIIPAIAFRIAHDSFEPTWGPVSLFAGAR